MGIDDPSLGDGGDAWAGAEHFPAAVATAKTFGAVGVEGQMPAFGVSVKVAAVDLAILYCYNKLSQSIGWAFETKPLCHLAQKGRML